MILFQATKLIKIVIWAIFVENYWLPETNKVKGRFVRYYFSSFGLLLTNEVVGFFVCGNINYFCLYLTNEVVDFLFVVTSIIFVCI
jgi:hypothetical protein